MRPMGKETYRRTEFISGYDETATKWRFKLPVNTIKKYGSNKVCKKDTYKQDSRR